MRVFARVWPVALVVVLVSLTWTLPVAAQNPSPVTKVTSVIRTVTPGPSPTLVPIRVDVPTGVAFPTDPVYGLPILPIGTFLPRGMITRPVTKVPGQVFYTPPPPGWYAPFQQGAPQANATPPASAASPGANKGGSSNSGAASSSASQWNNGAPGWIPPSYEQTQGQSQTQSSANSAPAISPSKSAEVERASTQAVQAQTQRYLDWKKSQVGTTQTRSVPDPKPLAPSSGAPTAFWSAASALANPVVWSISPPLDSVGQGLLHFAGNVYAAGEYGNNAARDVNAPLAAFADLGRRSEIEAKVGNPLDLPPSYFETNRLGVSPIGNMVSKETYQRTVTIPLNNNAQVPLDFTVPSALPVIGGQHVKIETSYDVYTTDQGVRNVRVHDPIGAFQWSQDFASSYAPNNAPRIVDGGFGNPLAMGAYNIAQTLQGKPPLAASGPWTVWFPGIAGTPPGWISGAALDVATARAYENGGGWFGINLGANFIDSAALCSDALARPSSFDRIAQIDPETQFVENALDVAGYADVSQVDGETFGGVLGGASDVAAGEGATASSGSPATETPTETRQSQPKGGVDVSGEQVYLKAVIPPGEPEWSLAFNPPFPVVVGQDPGKRGVDAQGQAVLGACTVIWHHVVHETWTYCGKQTCNCAVDNCEERTTTREWDTTEYEPDQIASVSVNTTLSEKSVAYIEGPMQSIYPGAKVIQRTVRLFPSEWSKASQVVGVPSVWQFHAERVPYADPGQWDVTVHLVTTGTAHCGPTTFDRTIPEMLTTWLREQRLVK